jgi:hypothetical protein
MPTNLPHTLGHPLSMRLLNIQARLPPSIYEWSFASPPNQLLPDDGEIGRTVLAVGDFGMDEGHAATGIVADP